MRRWLVKVAPAALAVCLPTGGWASPETQLSYFGLAIHKADDGSPWPPFKFGTWRIWDSRVTWVDLEPRRGEWRFEKLDRYVALADRFGIEISLVLAHSPAWASNRPKEASAYGLGRAAEPRDIEDWQRYVRTVTQRYRGRIKYYEIWNEPSDRQHFSGSMDAYLQLVRSAAEIVRASHPEARVVAPSVNGGAGHLKFVDEFLGRGGREHIDVLGHHFYVFRAGAEAIQPLIRDVKALMRKHRIEHLPLWNSEVGWWIADEDGTPEPAGLAKGGWRKLDSRKEAPAALLKTYTISRGEGVERTVWYAWDNSVGFGMIEPTSRDRKPISAAFQDTVNWLIGKSVEPCGIISGSLWRCELHSASGETQYVVWNSRADSPQRYFPPSRSSGWRYLEMGEAVPRFFPGNGLLLDEKPLLILPN